MKNVAAVPPNMPAESSDAPNIPSTVNIGTPEPVAPSFVAMSTLFLDFSISWYNPLSGMMSYCANAGGIRTTNVARHTPVQITRNFFLHKIMTQR